LWFVPQCAAVVTMRGWTKVPEHPFSKTVVGHWQLVAFCPPKIGSSIEASGSAVAGSDPHAVVAATERTVAATTTIKRNDMDNPPREAIPRIGYDPQ
jgi:hypothetical protein